MSRAIVPGVRVRIIDGAAEGLEGVVVARYPMPRQAQQYWVVRSDSFVPRRAIRADFLQVIEPEATS